MGEIHFQVHPPRRVTSEMAERAYFTAPDRSIWQSRTHLTDDGLMLERAASDSGYFHIPWPVEGFGELTLSTGWLMERDRPYQLEIELARGKLTQVRSQLFEWQAIGLNVPKKLKALIDEAVGTLATAATSCEDAEAAANVANEAIRSAVEAGQWLSRCYADQSLTARAQQSGRLETRLGIHLGGAVPSEAMGPLIKGSFSTGGVSLNWRKIEADEDNHDWSVTDRQIAWCKEKGLRVHAGPILSFDEVGVPDWLCLWQGDFDSLAVCVDEFVKAAVTRYRDQVDLWYCTARINVGDVLSLSQEDRLRMALRVMQLTRELDAKTPVIVSFDQPWGEYTSRESVDFPRYLADSLVRWDIGLAGLGMEINVGYFPGGTYPHDLLDFSQMLDHWSMLGLPLHVMLTAPSSSGDDPRAIGTPRPLSTAFPGGWQPKIQKHWAELYLPMLLSKSYMASVVWNQLLDSEPHRLPHSGLFDEHDHPKPALGVFAAMREKYLG